MVVDLKPDQLVNGVSLAESSDDLALMLVRAPDNIVLHAEIERAVFLAGEQVDVIGHEQAVEWIPGSALCAAPE
ncbi:hypothetical protein GCM10010987_24030 [Bradyrhizobium guangdongense]|uniref:Uncharacterized protein n=1 Tax=Bradyrhizobium guangdongense TaxID=1325090 RepID=A0AA88B7U0_9BRAD|nr:hypothetical protein GCM10010987_24030 [Bradyrhizobium guangdongense]